MKVLHIIASVDAEGGGPIEALRGIGEALDGRVTQEILSLDTPGSRLADKYPMQVHMLGHPARPGRTGIDKLRNWMTPSPDALAWGRAHLSEFDLVVVHGLWNASTRLAWLLLAKSGMPYVVYPHGMLDPWFRRRYPIKHLAKQCLWSISEGHLVNSANYVLFTSEQEKELARGSFYPYRAKERVINYGTTPPPPLDPGQETAFRALLPALGTRAYLLYLSRIHEKKGCDLLIKAFAAIAADHPTLDLVIAGPDREGLKPELQAIARKAGIADRIHWPGMIVGPEKYGAYRGATAFVLPSHQENFGIVVAEALSCGCPALISDKVNIWQEIETSGSGLVAPDTLEGTKDMLRRFLDLDASERAAMRLAGPRVFQEKFSIDAASQDFLRTLEELRPAMRPTLSVPA